MILAIAATDPALEAAAVEYLAVRSVTHFPLSPEDTDAERAARIETLNEARHYVVTGLGTPAELFAVQRRPGVRLLFLGDPPPAGTLGPLRALFERADAHVAGPTAQALDRIRDIALEAMSAFDRPSWDDYFMEIAHVVARRSNCMKRKVAAVIVRDKRIVTTGYNGTPRGARNCNEGGCPRCNTMTLAGTALEECLCNHAEENAIVQAAFHGISVRDATLYCTFSPCLHCTKLIINSGILEVVYDADYPMGARALDLLAECGVKARRYP